jgi:hypothetical protein
MSATAHTPRTMLPDSDESARFGPLARSVASCLPLHSAHAGANGSNGNGNGNGNGSANGNGNTTKSAEAAAATATTSTTPSGATTQEETTA